MEKRKLESVVWLTTSAKECYLKGITSAPLKSFDRTLALDSRQENMICITSKRASLPLC